MRLAYVTEWDPLLVRKWSGIPFHTHRAFQQVFEEVETIVLPEFRDRTGTIEEHLRDTGKLASDRLRDSSADLVFTQGLSALPYLETDLPTVLWHDAVWFGLMRKPFETFAKEDPEYLDWDRRMLANVDMLFMSSKWAGDLACDYYGYPRQQLRMLSYGVSFDVDWTLDDVDRAVARRGGEVCQLLFFGRRWKRKGLIHAVRLCERLNERGCAAKLIAVGCEPDDPEILASRHLEITGFLDKDKPDDLRRLEEILWRSHFLIHPARFECSGIGLTEANAFGVPVLASDVGGLRSTIEPGSNGELFKLEDFVERATQLITGTFDRYADAYPPLASSAFAYQQVHFDWHRSAQILKKEAGALLAERHG